MHFPIKKIAAFLFLAINLSPILWYDLRILSVRGLIGNVSTERLFLVWAILMLPFVMFYTLKISRQQLKHPLLAILISYILFSFLSSTTEQWPISGVFGDLYKGIILLSGFGLYYHCRGDEMYILRSIAKIAVVFMAVRFAFFVVLFQDITKLYYGTVYDVIGTIVALQLAQTTRSTTDLRLRLLRKPQFLFILLLSLLGQKRTAFVGTVMAISLNLRVRTVFILFLVALLATVFSGPFLLDHLSDTRFASLTSLEYLQEAELQRLSEISASYELWILNLKNFMVGAGFGAEIFAFSTEFNTFEYVHSVHNTLAGTLARSGFVGLLAYLAIVVIAVRGMFRAHVRKDATLVLAVVACSMFIYTLMDEALVGYFLARLLNHKEILNQTRERGLLA